MYGSIIVQGIGSPTPAVAPGFMFSQNPANKILFVQVPQKQATALECLSQQ